MIAEAWASRPWVRERVGKRPTRSRAGRPCHAQRDPADFTSRYTQSGDLNPCTRPARESASTAAPEPAAQVLMLVARMDVRKARLRTSEQWANEKIDALRADGARYYNFLVHALVYRAMAWGLPTFAGPVGFVCITLLSARQ